LQTSNITETIAAAQQRHIQVILQRYVVKLSGRHSIKNRT